MINVHSLVAVFECRHVRQDWKSRCTGPCTLPSISEKKWIFEERSKLSMTTMSSSGSTCSPLPNDDDGLETHFLKHLSVVFCKSKTLKIRCLEVTKYIRLQLVILAFVLMQLELAHFSSTLPVVEAIGFEFEKRP